MNKIIGRLVKELLHVLPAFIFFLIMFYILVVTKALTLREYGITPHGSAVAIVGALIVAKVILIADKLPFLNLYPKKPLAWNVALKTIAFGMITFVFLFVEETIRAAHKYGGFSAGYEHLKADIIWPALWVREIWLTVLLVFYCSGIELARIIGFERIREIFFGAPKR